MNMKKEFEYAAIFSADDVKDDFISCIASVMDECSSAAILVESQDGIDRIAELFCKGGNEISKLQIHEDVAEKYGIEVKATENLLNVAETIRASLTGVGMKLSVAEVINVAAAITKNYDISRK